MDNPLGGLDRGGFSAAAHSAPDSHAAMHGFRQWQVWAVLLLAGISGYMSVSLQWVLQDQLHMQKVLGTVASLSKSHTADNSEFHHWLVQAHQKLPEIERFDSRLTASLVRTLVGLKLTDDMLQPQQRVELQRHLTEAVVLLRQGESHLQRLQSHYTQFYYWSLLGFLLGVVVLFTHRGVSRRDWPVTQLRADRFLFPHVPLAMSLIDNDGRTLRVNKAFERLTGYASEEAENRYDVVRLDAGSVKAARSGVADTGFWSGEQKMRHKDGSVLSERVMWVGLGSNPVEPEAYLAMSTESVVPDDERRLMLWQAHHDNLTKLPNANLLHVELSRAVISAVQEGKRGALLSIDLDEFQQVNDSVGYEKADRVLTDTAMRIAMCARETDTVARMGGDLFVIAMHEIENVNEAERLALNAVDAIGKPFCVDDQQLFVSASVGVTVFPDDGAEKGELLQKADAARLRAKNEGGGHIMFFEDEMNAGAARRLALETNLRTAIEKEELALHYQPVVDVTSGTVYGAEALLRWHSAELGMVSPAEFIPIAEASGLIVEIGDWVVRAVKAQLQAWCALEAWPQLRISLNVSARQISSEANATALLESLKGEQAELLTVELTETALITESPGVQIFLRGLLEQNIKVALDDFGAGYSSIGYLRDFNFDVLKIDKSFVDDLASTREYGLIASVVAMGRILGMQIVAEGVEQETQVDSLRQIGCDFVQGYYFSRPLPAEEFAEFVLEHGKPAQPDAIERATG